MTDASPSPPKRKLLKPLLALGVGLALAAAFLDPGKSERLETLPDIPDEKLVRMRPAVDPYEGYAGSDSCRECHEHNHETWYASWHRTMTQEANLTNIIGNFDDVSITNELGQVIDLFTRDDRAWCRINYDQRMFIGANLPRKEYPIVMMTGSHHMQVYWYPAGRARTLAQLPVVYLKDDQRWVPRTAAFLHPSDQGYFATEVSRWNHTCLTCHSTNPDPRHLKDAPRQSYDTQVAELGISCEACHGPGQAHVAIHSAENPADVADLVDQIVDPGVLDHVRSSQVCGGCHSVSNRKTAETEWRDHKPGKDLLATREIQQGPVSESGPEEGEGGEEVFEGEEEEQKDATFWLDGMIRVSGREYNGLLFSKCHTAGEMSCVSCHSMHQERDDPRPPKEWANDQLHPDRMGDQACTQCHETKTYATPAHTHHAAGSDGSSCYNCHMPHTTYGLLKAIRSHGINSPNVRETLDANRPTACNLCHLDKTLAWTADHLHKWYGQEKPELTEEHRTVADAALTALRGDAGLRAIVAWHMSWEPAVKAANAEVWVQPYLAQLLEDPYEAVRYIAGHSLKSFAGQKDLDYDYVGRRDALAAAAAEARRRWEKQPVKADRAELLHAADGSLTPLFRELLSQRDDRDMSLLE